MSPRGKAYVHWVGFDRFEQKKLWLDFMPYVIFFLFAGFMGPIFRQKAELEEKPIDFGDKEPHADVEPTGEEPSYEESETPSISDRFVDVQYKLSYVLWKCKITWPLLDFIAKYNWIAVYCTIFAFALGFSWSAVWYLMIILCLMQFSSLTGDLCTLQLKLKKEYFEAEKTIKDHDSHTKEEIRIRKLRHRQKLEAGEEDLTESVRINLSETSKKLLHETRLNNDPLSQQARFAITDQDCVEQIQAFEKEANQLQLRSRTVYWHMYFLTAAIAICSMYASVFLVAQYNVTDAQGNTTATVNFIENETTRNKFIFVTFWAGIYRNNERFTDL